MIIMMVTPSRTKKKTRARVSVGVGIVEGEWMGWDTYIPVSIWISNVEIYRGEDGNLWSKRVDKVAQVGMRGENTLIMCLILCG
jgi:hypothetical protein